MKCEICNKTAPGDGATLYRTNALGEIGVWRCEEHLTEAQRATIDPEVLRLTKIIEAASS